MAAWTPVMVANWLELRVGLPEYWGPQFLAQNIDGAALLEGFSDQELREELGVRSLGHRRRLQRELHALRQTSSGGAGVWLTEAVPARAAAAPQEAARGNSSGQLLGDFWAEVCSRRRVPPYRPHHLLGPRTLHTYSTLPPAEEKRARRGCARVLRPAPPGGRDRGGDREQPRLTGRGIVNSDGSLDEDLVEMNKVDQLCGEQDGLSVEDRVIQALRLLGRLGVARSAPFLEVQAQLEKAA